MKRKLLICTLVFSSLFIHNSVSKGSESFNSLISEREVVVLNNNEELLYKQFKNQELAINFAKENYGEVLSNIKVKYSLGELSEKNWEKYYEIVRTIALDNNGSQLITLRKFFDIFENKYKNDKIKIKIKYLKEIRSVDEYDEELTYLMPSNSNYSNKYHQSNMELDKKTEEILENLEMKPVNMSRAVSSNLPNQKAAIEYDKKHATNPNTGKYHYYAGLFRGGDCANFVSQIFEAGGRKQVVYNGSYTIESGGWWHYFTYGSGNLSIGDYGHHHSLAWMKSNTFVHYFGTHMTTTNHRVFSAQINPGSVIAFDDYDDGDWEHVAYVTEADNYTANYNGKVYYDYKVAQHSKNYHLWTSNSGNGWETLEDDGARYAICKGLI